MEPLELLMKAKADGMTIDIVEGELRVTGPASKSHWIDKISEQKPAILALLSGAPETPTGAVKFTTLEKAAQKYIGDLQASGGHLIETGIPDLDQNIGGGIAPGEVIVLAARSGHGKTAVVLQMLHTATANLMPCLMISEEMSASAIGKRTIQYASDIPHEHWLQSTPEVQDQMTAHFERRAICYVAEQCGTVERVVEAIEQAVKQNDVEIVAVDYAQLLRGSGSTRYEIATNTSIRLREVAKKLGITLILLCQMSRDIERRPKFLPQMSDIRDSGQFEQDADLILFLCWPHRLDSDRDPHEFTVFVAKNRNRETLRSAIPIRFEPSRLTLRHSLDEYPEDDGPGRDYQQEAF